MDYEGNETEVLGLIDCEVDGAESNISEQWNTSMIELHNKNKQWVWMRGKATIAEKATTSSSQTLIGKTLITRAGTYVIVDKNTNVQTAVRDFTDVGYMQIQKTYSMIADRLRLLQTH